MTRLIIPVGQLWKHLCRWYHWNFCQNRTKGNSKHQTINVQKDLSFCKQSYPHKHQFSIRFRNYSETIPKLVETAKFEKRWFQTIKGKCRKCPNPSCLRPDRGPTPERPPCGKKASKGLATTTARAIVIAKRLPITTWISLFPCCCWNCPIRSDWGRDRSMGCCLLLLCLLLFRSWRHPASSAATFFLAGRSVGGESWLARFFSELVFISSSF